MAGWLAESQRRRNIPSALCHLGVLGVVRDGHAQFLAYRRLGSPLLLVPVGEPHSAHLLFPFARCGPCIGRGKAASQGLRSSSSIPAVGPSDFAQTAFHTTNDAAASCFPACACCLLACTLGRRWPLSAWAPQCTANPRPPSSCSARIQRPRIN